MIRPKLEPSADDAAAGTDRVTVGGDCVTNGVGESVEVGGAGVGVGVAGGVMSSSSFWVGVDDRGAIQSVPVS